MMPWMQFVKWGHLCWTKWRIIIVTRWHQMCGLLFSSQLQLLHLHTQWVAAERSRLLSLWFALISHPSISSAFRRSNLPWRWQINGGKMSTQMKNKYFILWIQRGERLSGGSLSRHNLLPFHLASVSCGKQNSSLILHSVCFYIFINYHPDHQRRLFTLLPASYFTSVTLHLRHFHLPETLPPPPTTPPLIFCPTAKLKKTFPLFSSPLLTTVFKFFS